MRECSNARSITLQLRQNRTTHSKLALTDSAGASPVLRLERRFSCIGPLRSRSGRATSPTSRRSNSAATADRDALLKALFPNGIPPREDVIRAVNNWLDNAELLTRMA